MRKVYFAVFGSGLGHITRALDIASRLESERKHVRWSCSGQGLEYMRRHEPQMDFVECPPFDVEWTEEGSFSSRDFALHFPRMIRSFLRQVSFEKESIASYTPTVTVSDSRLSAVLASKSNTFPVITILNQFKIVLPPRFSRGPIGRLYERIGGDVLGLMWSLSDQVLLTDLPPPYTIGEVNVKGTDVSNIVRYVGFTSPNLDVPAERLQKVKSELGFDKRPVVFFQISGPDATKARFVSTATRAAMALSNRYNVVVSNGYASGSSIPRRLAGGAIVYDWCPIRNELLLLSDVLVARAGHRTIGQCIDAGKPAVLVPIHNHSEQLGNAAKFQRLSLGLTIRQEDLSVTLLEQYVDLSLSDSKYSMNVDALRLISKRYNGVAKCSEIIKSYMK